MRVDTSSTLDFGTGPAEPFDQTLAARVQTRLAAYVRSWGVRDASIVAEHARRWTKQTLNDCAARGRIRATEVELAAVARATNSVYLWIARLARSCESERCEVSHGLVALKLRKLLAIYPEAFLRIERLPEKIIAPLRSAARSVVPHAQPTAMPPQPLGELVPIFQAARWRNGMHGLGAWLGLAQRAAESSA